MQLADFLRHLDTLKRGGTPYGKAPHKPVFLLSLLDLLDREGLPENHFTVTAAWVALFKENFNRLVDTPHHSEFGLPFFHLQTDGFWVVYRRDGFELKF